MIPAFISYRREDALGIAGRIFDRLVAHYGAEQVFLDVDTIPFGAEFRHFINRTAPVGRSTKPSARASPS
jgi:hypothetical protein